MNKNKEVTTQKDNEGKEPKKKKSWIADDKNKVTLQIKCMFLLLKLQSVAPVESRPPLLSVSASTLRTVTASRP